MSENNFWRNLCDAPYEIRDELKKFGAGVRFSGLLADMRMQGIEVPEEVEGAEKKFWREQFGIASIGTGADLVPDRSDSSCWKKFVAGAEAAYKSGGRDDR